MVLANRIFPKEGQSLLFCVDYLKRNAVTARDSYPVPGLAEFIVSSGYAKIFFTLDANN